LADTPFSEAVICTFVSVLTAAAVAVNAALVAPEATVTEAGTVTLPLRLDKLTKSPPLGAAAVRLTMHVLVPAPVSDAGLQLIPAGTTVTVGTTTAIAPPVAVAGIESPVREATTTFVIPIGTDAAEGIGDNVAVTLATAPLPIVFAFRP
jgi:hypothetical protein